MTCYFLLQNQNQNQEFFRIIFKEIFNLIDLINFLFNLFNFILFFQVIIIMNFLINFLLYLKVISIIISITRVIIIMMI